MRTLRTYRLGRVEYADGLALMRLAGEAVRAGAPPEADHLFLVEHPPVVTLGRGADGRNVLADPAWLAARGFEVHETDRGGDVTYHGPGQVVAYPVLDLSDRPDVRRYVAALEEAMIATCADLGVEAGRHPEHRGAWVGPKKIGAVGVHLSRWVTSHGLAFNVRPDLSHFRAIVPCGIAEPGLGVTSLEAELAAAGRVAPPTAEVEDRLASRLAGVLGRARADVVPALRTVSVVPVAADGRILLLRRSEARGGFWQQVTGRVEGGESPAQAARRELREETGADVPVVDLGYRHAFALDPSLRGGAAAEGITLVEEHAFAARLPPGFAARLSDEHAEQALLPPEEAVSRLRFAGLRRAVRLAAGASR
jgi:lipoyl(octanoyl) transferase